MSKARTVLIPGAQSQPQTDVAEQELAALREQVAALQAQNEALAAQAAAQAAEAAQVKSTAVDVPAVPATVLPASQKAVLSEQGYIVPPTYGSPINRPR